TTTLLRGEIARSVDAFGGICDSLPGAVSGATEIADVLCRRVDESKLRHSIDKQTDHDGVLAACFYIIVGSVDRINHPDFVYERWLRKILIFFRDYNIAGKTFGKCRDDYFRQFYVGVGHPVIWTGLFADR